jgi:acyl dehydratase
MLSAPVTPVNVGGGAAYKRFPAGLCGEVSVSRLYWEDFTPGRAFAHGPRRMTRNEIVAFAAEFDPQPMHLDEDAARQTMLGGLSASGWHACCILMRMSVDAFVGDSASMGSPGIDEVKWLRPIHPGDDISLRATVLEARASRSKPGMGMVKFRFELTDAAGATVMTLVTLVTTLMMGRREAGSAPA